MSLSQQAPLAQSRQTIEARIEAARIARNDALAALFSQASSAALHKLQKAAAALRRLIGQRPHSHA
jgi:hypothetical protein